MVDGEETFPLVPVAVGLYSTVFNIFNLCLLFPFIGVFERVLQGIGRTDAENIEDFSTPRYLDRKLADDLAQAVPAVENETSRHLEAGALFLDIARGSKSAPSDPGEHYQAVDILNRDIRNYSSALFREDMPLDQLDLVGSLIEEADFTASLAESLHQVARRVKREEFSSQARIIVEAGLSRLDAALSGIRSLPEGMSRPVLPAGHRQTEEIDALRHRVLTTGSAITSGERGAILPILGSIERAEMLIARIDAERKSVNRGSVLSRARSQAPSPKPRETGGLSPVPAE